MEYCPLCDELIALIERNGRMECPECDYTDDDTILPIVYE